MGFGFWTDNTVGTTPPSRSYLDLDLPGREVRGVQQHRGIDANVGPSNRGDRWEV